jgi:hypothetical protein
VNRLAVAAIAALALVTPACGEEEQEETPPDPSEESSDRPAKPPRGWRSLKNAKAGFTISVPRAWSARTKSTATLIRSDDQLVSMTVGADRTRDGREIPAKRFVLETIHGLPAFKGRASRRTRRVRSSRYESARIEARGRIETSKLPQRITVAAFRKPGRVTYTVLVFRNARVKPRFNEPAIERMLRSFRAQAPDFTP